MKQKYHVQIIADAKQDLIDIYQYVAENDSFQKADKLLDQLEKLCLSLQQFPERGHLPPELDRLSISTYREIHFKPYRIIYQLIEKEVYIHAAIDGRRNLEQFLLHRLLNKGS